MKLNQPAKELYDLLYTQHFDPERLKTALESGRYDEYAVNAAAIRYVEDSQACVRDTLPEDEDRREQCGIVVPGLPSSHLLEAMEILLCYGLDPNRNITDPETGYEYNIMHELYWVDNGYMGPDALLLMMEHGGDPELRTDNENLFWEVDFDLLFDLNEMPDRALYDAKVRCWMVLVSYGAKCMEGREPAEPCGRFDFRQFRDFRNYYFGAIHSDRSEDGWEICFFDRATNWEVARA